ncbi:MAG TPA: DUF2089 domain-containing protein [Vicinamibacterales bacterium]|nr:DUF2089 domain-containing protein [Vicinamibacterales bacterium]
MSHDWQELTKLIGQARVEIDRVRLVETGVVIEGPFALPPLAQLPAEDQVFVAAFVRCHGSIKQMEQYFGVSYPTVKNRLNRIGSQLSFVEIEQGPESVSPARTRGDVLDRLSRGELTVAQALEQLKEM